MVVAGGTLDVTGQLTVDGTLSLANGSTLEGGTVDACGGLSVEGNVAISATTLNNSGAATWDQSYYAPNNNNITLSNGAVINNLAGATFTTVCDTGYQGQIIAGDSSAVAFNNAGSFLCAGASGTSGTYIGVPFTQASTGTTVIQGQGGELGLGGESTIAGAITAEAGAGLIFEGGGTVSGSISGAAGTVINFYGSSYTLDASSSVTCDGTVYFQQIGAVTVAGTYDVSGSTRVTGGPLIFTAPIADLGADLDINEGTVDITTAQSLSFTSVEINNVGTLSGASSVNVAVTGSMSWVLGTISGLETLTIASGATLSLDSLHGGVETLDGTTLDNAGTGTFTSEYYTDGIRLVDGAGIDNQPGASFTFLDGYDGAYIYSDSSPTFLTNQGSLIVASGSNPTAIQAATFTETSTGSTEVVEGSLEFDGTATISGSMTAGVGTTMTFTGPATSLISSSSLTSAGTVVLVNAVTVAGAYDVTGTTVANSSNGVIFTAPIVDMGAYVNVGSANLDITSNQSFSFTYLDVDEGTFSGGGGNLTVTGAMVWGLEGTISGFGTLTIASGAALSLSTGQFIGTETLDGVRLVNAGAASFLGVSDNIGLALDNGAEFVNKPGASFTILTSGLISSDGTATSFLNEGNLIEPATAIGQTIIQPVFTQTSTGMTMVDASDLNLEGGGLPVTNAGEVTIESGGTLAVSTNYDQTAGSTALLNSTMSGGNLNIQGGTLAGTGAVNASVTNAGQVIPGGTGAAGLLTINGNYMQTATGSLDIELGGTTAGSQYDQLAVSGTASLGGQLNVSLINSFQPVLGNAFQVVTFTSYAGNFGFYNGTVLGNRLILNPTLNPANLTLTVQPAVTTTTLSAPPSPSVCGQSVTFTATVSVALPPTTIDPTPTGTVTFYNNGASIGTGALNVVDGQEQANFTTSTLSTASHLITATYTSGDTNFVPSPVSTAVTQVVNKDSTTTSVSATPSLANVGQTVTFMATVAANSAGSGTPTGTVDFYDSTTSTDLTPGGIALESGTATFLTTGLAAGSHIIEASYSGDPNFLTSSASTGNIAVGKSVIVLDPSAGGALSLSGNANINLTGGVYVDSSSTTALSASGNAATKASVIVVHGGVQKSGNASFSPAPVTGAATVPDPLASLAEPSRPA